MKTRLLLLLLSFCSFSSLFAYEHTIQGQFTDNEIFGFEFEQFVWLTSEDIALDTFIIADSTGFFTTTINVSDDITTPVTISIFTIDWCTGENQFQELEFSGEGVTELEFSHCDLGDCFASFNYQFDYEDPLTLVFTDQSWATEITAVNWDFGDGTTSTESNPTHTFPADGEYVVNYQITTADSCTSETSYHVYVGDGYYWDECYAYIYYEQGQLFPEQIQFYSENFLPAISHFWRFCVVNTSTEANPMHTYTESGQYEVTYESQMLLGEDTCSNTTYNYVHVEVNDTEGPRCLASFQIQVIDETEDGLQQIYTFMDRSEATGEVIGWEWTFQDGTTSNEQNPTKTFDFSGIARIGLTITTSDGCSSTVSYDYWVGGWNNECWTGFQITPQNNDSTNIVVEFTAANHGSGTLVSWLWDFGDGNTSTEASPTHTYAEGGEYLVRLDVTTDEGCTSRIQYFIEVGYCVCYNYYEPVCATDPDSGETFFFNSVCEAECAGYTDFGECETDCHCEDDGQPVCVEIETGETVEFPNSCEAFCAGYWYFDSCDGSDGNDGIDTPECQAMFWFGVAEGNAINFFDLSETDTTIVSWTWDFGNGDFSSEAEPNYTYDEEGVYLVTLTIITASGCESTFAVLVWTNEDLINNSDCQALFFPVLDGNNILAIDMSIGGIESWEWDMGDGTTFSNTQEVFHTYEDAAGEITVTLKITTVDGCESTFAVVLNLGLGSFHGDSNPAALSVNTNETATILQAIEVAPNPTADFAQLQISTTQSIDYQLNIVSSIGQVLQQSKGTLNTGEQQLTVDLSQFSAGVYYVTLNTEGQTWTERVVKY
ncbi:MAG: PKD domain-containing protein [Saprospiraceae bacterium]